MGIGTVNDLRNHHIDMLLVHSWRDSWCEEHQCVKHWTHYTQGSVLEDHVWVCVHCLAQDHHDAERRTGQLLERIHNLEVEASNRERARRNEAPGRNPLVTRGVQSQCTYVRNQHNPRRNHFQAEVQGFRRGAESDAYPSAGWAEAIEARLRIVQPVPGEQ